MTLATARQIAAIHAEAKRLGIDDASRRDLMEAVTGLRSAKGMSEAQAQAVVRKLKGFGGDRSPAGTVTGRYAGVLRALWLSAWHLGAVRSADDRALIAFCKRQTGLDHTRFLTEGADANRAIEAIKGMCARAGVEWPKGTRPSVVAQKRAVVIAILARLATTGATIDAPALDHLDGPALDRLQVRFGARLRDALGMEGSHG